MSNYGPESTDPEGRFERTCASCGVAFRTDWPRQTYCSPKCKRRAQNARHYRKHSERIKIEALANYHQKART